MVSLSIHTNWFAVETSLECWQSSNLQIDVDIGSSSVARSIISLVLGYITSIVVDLAILIEVWTGTISFPVLVFFFIYLCYWVHDIKQVDLNLVCDFMTLSSRLCLFWIFFRSLLQNFLKFMATMGIRHVNVLFLLHVWFTFLEHILHGFICAKQFEFGSTIRLILVLSFYFGYLSFIYIV